MEIKDKILQFKCLKCNKNLKKKFNEDLKKKFFNTRSFGNFDVNTFVLVF